MLAIVVVMVSVVEVDVVVNEVESIGKVRGGGNGEVGLWIGAGVSLRCSLLAGVGEGAAIIYKWSCVSVTSDKVHMVRSHPLTSLPSLLLPAHPPSLPLHPFPGSGDDVVGDTHLDNNGFGGRNV